MITQCKVGSLYNYGMKIAMFSQKKWKESKIGWFRGGDNINYVMNNYIKPVHLLIIQNSSQKNHYSTLTFSYTFEYDNDIMSMAFSHPYTYTDLQEDLLTWEKFLKKSYYFSKEVQIGRAHV